MIYLHFQRAKINKIERMAIFKLNKIKDILSFFLNLLLGVHFYKVAYLQKYLCRKCETFVMKIKKIPA
jgi:hypothetical protein